MLFVESKHFTRAVVSRLSDDEYADMQLDLAERPDRGNVIEGSGGIRKIRFGLMGRGKSGGVRVIYYWRAARDTILMLDVYAKNEKSDLTPDEIKTLRRIVEGDL